MKLLCFCCCVIHINIKCCIWFYSSQKLVLCSNRRPYKCTFCEKGFNQEGNLNIHLRSHTGEQPYRCNICSRRFNQKGEYVLKEFLKDQHVYCVCIEVKKILIYYCSNMVFKFFVMWSTYSLGF